MLNIEAKTGVVVIDNYGRKVMLVERDYMYQEPNMRGWLNCQEDHRMRNMTDAEVMATEWWSAYPLTGGSVCVPISLCTCIGMVTAEEYVKVFTRANLSAQMKLAALSINITDYRR